VAADPVTATARFDTQLRGKSRSSVGWSMVRFASDQLFSFLVFVVLARLLSPRELGAFALMAIFAEVFRTITSAGVIPTIAREAELTPAFTDTVYKAQLWASCFACGLVLMLAGPFADFMRAPQIELPLQIMSAVLPISALGGVHMALRLRAFGHKTTAIRSVACGLVGGTAAVVAALLGAGLWALVIQRVLSEIVSTILSRSSYRYTPGRAFSWPILKRCLNLNGSLVTLQLVFLFTQRLQELVIGAAIGVIAVGIYRTAWRTVELISQGAIRPFATVAMQTLARVRHDRVELTRAYQWMISKASAISLPALIGFSALAPLAVPTIFGQRWAQAGELAQIFAFMALPFSLNQFASSTLGAVGASRSLTAIAVTQLGLTALFTWASAPYGITAVAWAYVARAYLTLPLQIVMFRRAAGIGFGDTWAAVWQPLAAASVMGVVVRLGLIPLGALPALVQLAILIATGALVYGATLLALSPMWRGFVSRQLLKRRS
jgi:O-antigen/teichoic acid export membrane protein